MKTARLGTVSHGTMRPEDLIPAFAYELRKLRGALPRRLARDVRDSLTRLSTDCGTGDGFIHDTVSALIDALQEYAPPYAYFGTHEGDGSDYGFWVCDLDQFDGLRVDDTSEVPRSYRGEVLHVNDHGNVTLYVATSRGLREVWGIV